MLYRRPLRSLLEASGIALLLSGVLALVCVLALQAHSAFVGHRELAEEVLNDYATLAADEALRRVSAEVGFYGYRPTIALLQKILASHPERPPDRAELRGLADERTARGLELVHETFYWNNEEAAQQGSEDTSRPWYASPLAAAEPVTDAPFLVVQSEQNGEPVAAVVAASGGQRPTTIGFEVEWEALRQWCLTALNRGPLLPTSLGYANAEGSPLFLRIVGGAGNTLCSTGRTELEAVTVERAPPEGSVAILPGLRAYAGIPLAAAPQLVIGGMPRSTLPLLLTLLAMTAGLLVTALIIVRRQHALTRLRAEFVSQVSHELRTPLAQIRMFAETLLLDRVRNEEERSRSLQIIDRESRRLSALVDKVLQFSRSEKGVAHITLRPVRLREAVARVAEEVTLLAQDSKSTVVASIPETLEVLADEDSLHQILLNLIDNAIKHGPPSQQVRVSARGGGDRVWLFVEDQGMGIPVEERDRVWEPFRRIHNTEHPVAGTGIGLAIVRELVERHGGSCWFEDGESGGTRVVLELPSPAESRSEEPS